MSSEGTPYKDGFGERSQFIVKAYQSQDQTKDAINRIVPETSYIDATQSDSSKNILHLRWKPLSENSKVTYSVLLTPDT